MLQDEIQNDNNEKTNIKQLIYYNFKVINDLLAERKKAIASNKYSSQIPLAKYYDQELVTHLDATFNILQIMDDRLTKLEKHMQN